jgi:transcriptional antiterminator Rof (Rho-off)
MSEPYRPISCDFHDELCLLALRRRVCEIVYRHSTKNSRIMPMSSCSMLWQ